MRRHCAGELGIAPGRDADHRVRVVGELGQEPGREVSPGREQRPDPRVRVPGERTERLRRRRRVRRRRRPDNGDCVSSEPRQRIRRYLAVAGGASPDVVPDVAREARQRLRRRGGVAGDGYEDRPVRFDIRVFRVPSTVAGPLRNERVVRCHPGECPCRRRRVRRHPPPHVGDVVGGEEVQDIGRGVGVVGQAPPPEHVRWQSAERGAGPAQRVRWGDARQRPARQRSRRRRHRFGVSGPARRTWRRHPPTAHLPVRRRFAAQHAHNPHNAGGPPETKRRPADVAGDTAPAGHRFRMLGK